MDAIVPNRPVFARHAVSLVLWRTGPSGPEVLMGLRGAGHRFMPNRLVFPGGAVDPADHRAPAATELDPATLDLLRRNAGPLLARGLAVAATRELQEETGLSFGGPPRLDGLDYLCRAVTPPQLHMRFNARFLIADARDVQGTPNDSRELEGVRFYPLAEALTLDLMLVTREVLLRAQAYLALPPAERRAPRELHVFKGRVWQTERATAFSPRRVAR